MPFVTENGHTRWDAGGGTTALGIIGTTLGGLATAVAGGNALTGATTRTANALGANIGYRFEPIKSLTIQPKLGLAAVHTRDEIYNNLDFAGVGGSAHGPVVRKTVLSPTAGLVIGYQLTKSIEARLGYEHYFLSGSDTALGKGNVGTVLAGVRIGL